MSTNLDAFSLEDALEHAIRGWKVCVQKKDFTSIMGIVTRIYNGQWYPPTADRSDEWNRLGALGLLAQVDPKFLRNFFRFQNACDNLDFYQGEGEVELQSGTPIQSMRTSADLLVGLATRLYLVFREQGMLEDTTLDQYRDRMLQRVPEEYHELFWPLPSASTFLSPPQKQRPSFEDKSEAVIKLWTSYVTMSLPEFKKLLEDNNNNTTLFLPARAGKDSRRKILRLVGFIRDDTPGRMQRAMLNDAIFEFIRDCVGYVYKKGETEEDREAFKERFLNTLSQLPNNKYLELTDTIALHLKSLRLLAQGN